MSPIRRDDKIVGEVIKKQVYWNEIDDFDLSCPFCKEKDEKSCEYCIEGEAKVSSRTTWGLSTIFSEDYEEKRKEVIKRSNCFLTYNCADVDSGHKGGLSGGIHKIVVKESIKTVEKVECNLHENIKKLREYISNNYSYRLYKV
jgi:hypothetical protein